MKIPTRILSNPVKVPRKDCGGYYLNFETDAGMMSSQEILDATGMTKNVFHYRGKNEGWTSRDFFRPSRKRNRPTFSGTGGGKKQNYMLGGAETEPADFIIWKQKRQNKSKEMKLDHGAREQQYQVALRRALECGGLR
jgi:hypothetical protein